MNATDHHDEEFLGRSSSYLDLPEDYIRELKTLADRYNWTFGIFMREGFARLETIKPGGVKHNYVTIIRPTGTVEAKPVKKCTKQKTK